MPSNRDDQKGPFLNLSPNCALKRLESPFLYNRATDRLYELDLEAMGFLASSPPVETIGRDQATADVVDFCRGEGLVVESEVPSPRCIADPPRIPSLRYLLIHITDRCNLACRHCFLGAQKGNDLVFETIIKAGREFEKLQGLRFIVSGGEPLVHPRFWDLNDRIPEFSFRSVLLTNGTLIDRRSAKKLRFHEVQVSVDGLEEAHDLLRGKGSYRNTTRGLRFLAEAGVDLSVATMVHSENIDQFERLREVLGEFPLKSWMVDVPCLSGNLLKNQALMADMKAAADRVRYSFGGGYYGSTGFYGCGAHLAAIMADGSICKCGHFAHRPVGTFDEGGLQKGWFKIRPVYLEDLACRCSHLKECRGGCRYRAQTFSCVTGPDPIQCFLRGVPLGGDMTSASS